MRTITRETYYCDFCNKMYLTKGSCAKHEIKCYKNPENFRPCFECKGLQIKKIDIPYTDGLGNDRVKKDATVYHCKFIDMYVIPPKAEHRNRAYKIPNSLNEFMPKKCEAKEEKTFEDFIDLNF